jgi:ParB-like chromosome segregation protein Spo0J
MSATETPEAPAAATETPKGSELIEKSAIFKYGNRTFKIPYVKLADPLTKEEDKDLEESIKALGVIHAVVVTEDNTVLAGHNRLMKAKKLEIPLKDVPIQVRKRDAGTEEQIEVAYASNFIGRKFTPERRAHAAHMLAKLDFSARRIAKVIGVHHTTVIDDLSKADPFALPEEEEEEEATEGGEAATNGAAAGGKKKAKKGGKDFVIGSDNKKHPKKKKRKAKSADQEVVANQRAKLVRRKWKKNAITAIGLLVRSLDRLGIGEKHAAKLQALMDEVRAVEL